MDSHPQKLVQKVYTLGFHFEFDAVMIMYGLDAGTYTDMDPRTPWVVYSRSDVEKRKHKLKSYSN